MPTDQQQRAPEGGDDGNGFREEPDADEEHADVHQAPTERSQPGAVVRLPMPSHSPSASSSVNGNDVGP